MSSLSYALGDLGFGRLFLALEAVLADIVTSESSSLFRRDCLADGLRIVGVRELGIVPSNMLPSSSYALAVLSVLPVGDPRRGCVRGVLELAVVPSPSYALDALLFRDRLEGDPRRGCARELAVVERVPFESISEPVSAIISS